MRKHQNHHARPVLYRAVSLALLLTWSLPVWANNPVACPTNNAAAASATALDISQEQVEKPLPSNPYVQAIRGPQCVNQASSYGSILQEINSLPMSGTDSQVLHIIEMLFSTTANACSTNALPTSSSGPGTSPALNLVTQSALAATPYSGGQGSSSNLYQSLFP